MIIFINVDSEYLISESIFLFNLVIYHKIL